MRKQKEHEHKELKFNMITNWFYWAGCGCNSHPDAPLSNWTFFTPHYRSRPQRTGKWGR